MLAAWEKLVTFVSRQTPSMQLSSADSATFNDIMQYLPLNAEMRKFYQSKFPEELVIPTIGNDLVIYSSERLIASQVGYRWENLAHIDKLLDFWDYHWVVIGDIGADPIIAHANMINTPVSIALHGTGTWEPQRITLGLTAFFEGLRVWYEVSQIRYDGKFMSDDSDLLPNVKDDCQTMLIEVMSGDEADKFLSCLLASCI